MTLTCQLDPPSTPSCATAILALWTDVSNAGGAVGFVPPVTADESGPSWSSTSSRWPRAAAGCWSAATSGAGVAADRVPRLQHPPADGALGVAVHGDGPPPPPGAGLRPRSDGRRRARPPAASTASRRSGSPAAAAPALERFYAACGYKEVGRVPDAIRVAPGDDRDDITMLYPLNGQ